MLNENGPIAAEIKEVFDPEYLEHQIKNKVFDLHKLVVYAGEKMLQLCAPVRDPQIRAIGQETDIVTALFKLLDVLEEMRLDLANFRLQSIKPHLMQQAVEYEKLKFNQALSNGQASLDKTRAWLTTAATELQKVADSRNPENLEHPDLRLKFNNVLNHAYLSLLFANSAIDQRTLAETLSMDAQRLFEMQNELQAMTIVSALTMLSKNIIPALRSDPAVIKQLTASLFDLLKKEGTNIETLVNEIIEAGNILYHQQTKVISNLSTLTSNVQRQELKEISAEQRDLIKSMVEKTLTHKDPFFSVLSRRMEKIVRVALERNFRRDSLAKNGLDAIETEFEPLVKRITALVKHNKDVYGVHYDAILNSLV